MAFLIRYQGQAVEAYCIKPQSLMLSEQPKVILITMWFKIYPSSRDITCIHAFCSSSLSYFFSRPDGRW